MAAMNGLDPNGVLLEGTVLKLPGGAPAPAGASQPEPATHVVPDAAPAPTAQHVTAADIQSVANAHGVSPSLAAAIAWQESGFNNSMVSSANARGVMQVMPGTWDYVQENLAGGQALDPNSATDNIHAGVMYLKRLLTDAGGDENAAIAGYYQGLASVRERGMYDDTQQYVNNVQALRGRFGG
jgi:soluble lytic murein transglycosylase-like protein